MTAPEKASCKACPERRRLEAEIARLRAIFNEDGLVDPELSQIAGEPIDILRVASTDKRDFKGK